MFSDECDDDDDLVNV